MKFFLLLVLSLPFCSFAAAQNSDGWITIPWNPSDSVLVGALNAGLEDAIPQAQFANQLAPGQWSLAQVTEVMDLPDVDNGTNYAFEVNVINGPDTASLALVVSTSSGGQVNQLIYWKMNN